MEASTTLSSKVGGVADWGGGMGYLSGEHATAVVQDDIAIMLAGLLSKGLLSSLSSLLPSLPPSTPHCVDLDELGLGKDVLTYVKYEDLMRSPVGVVEKIYKVGQGYGVRLRGGYGSFGCVRGVELIVCGHVCRPGLATRELRERATAFVGGYCQGRRIQTERAPGKEKSEEGEEVGREDGGHEHRHFLNICVLTMVTLPSLPSTRRTYLPTSRTTCEPAWHVTSPSLATSRSTGPP